MITLGYAETEPGLQANSSPILDSLPWRIYVK